MLLRREVLPRREVFFLTGADEHGQKIADTAAAQGLKPIELVDKCVAQFKHLDWTLGCSFDGCAREEGARPNAPPSTPEEPLSRRWWW